MVTNTASVTADPGETDTGNNSGSDNIDVTPIVDLAITKSVDLTENAQAGTQLTYSISVTNGGPSPATNVQAVDTLPAGVTFVSGVGPNREDLSESGGQVTVDGGRMVSGDDFSFTIMVSVDSGASGTLENRVTVDSDVTDTDSNNNTATASTTVDPVTSEIVGTVFFDLNANGMLDPGEHRITGVMMTLAGTDALGNSVQRMVMTNDNGEYMFGSLPAGIYDVIQRQPFGFRNGQLEPGSGATATVGENEFLDLMLEADTLASGWNFGELRQRLSKRLFLASYLGSIVKST
jgi:uncharacterized repeat protein (TIGR01451 family)